MKCQICSQEMEADAKFCAMCGKKIPRCPTCGEVLYERSRFCANDGTPLPEELFAGFPPEGGAARAAAVPPAQPAARPLKPAVPPGKKKKGGAGAAAAAVILVVLLAAAGAGGYYVYQNGLPSFLSGADASSSEDRSDRDDRKDEDDRDEDKSSESGEDEELQAVQKALEQADAYAGAREYAHALAVIREALEDHPRSRELEDALEDYEALYASTLLSDADRLIGEGRLEEAKTLLEQRLVSLPGRPDLQDKLHQVEDLIAQAGSAAPVSMSGVLSVSASSWLEEPSLSLYHTPERTTDGDLKTAWVEGVDGDGVGEWISFEFDKAYLVSGIKINAGYQKSAELYGMNNRPASLTVVFSDGTQQTVQLQDVNGVQDIPFSSPAETKSVRLSIASVYSGSTYQDTVISELSFY